MLQIAAESTPSKNLNVWGTVINTPPVTDLFATADDALFSRVTSNPLHVLQPGLELSGGGG